MRRNLRYFIRRNQRACLIAAIFLLLLLIGLAVWLLVALTRSKVDESEITYAYGVPVVTDLMDPSLPGRPGIERTVKYVVIHETGNPSAGAGAHSHSLYLQTGSSGETSWHYTVDDHEIYHHIPDNEVAWHAGDRETPDGGNLCGIGVELCVNEGGDFEKTFDNGARLTAFLLKRHHLGIGDIRQHGDFIQKNCPQTIRENSRWQEFLERVSVYLTEDDG